MAIENAKFGKGITLAGGFDLGAKAPLDSRLTVATIEERDAHVTGNRAYDGMLVFVEADKVTYQYIVDAEGNGEWKEFGFNEADFIAHVADDLVTEDATKALSAKQGKVLDEKIGELAGLIGELPEGTTAKDVVDYVNIKTAGIATDAALEELNNQVSGLQEVVQGIQDDYLKEEDKTELSNAIVAEKERAELAEKANADAIKAISDDYLKGADKTELQGNIDAVSGKVTKLIGEDADKSVRTIANEELAKQLIAEGAKESLDTLAEIASWIQEHPQDAAAMNKAIEDLEALVGTLPEGVTATTIVAYVQEMVNAEKSRAEGIESGLEERLAAAEEKLADVEADAEVNVIEVVKVNGEALTVTDKAVDITIPTGALAGKDKVAEADLETALAEKINAKADASALEDAIDALEQADAKVAEDAAADAKAKADKALEDAKGYADGLNTAMDTRMQAVEGAKHTHANEEVLTGITSEKISAWDASEENAKDYTDEQMEAEVLARNEAIATAKSESATDATTKANKALDDAKAYTDAEVAKDRLRLDELEKVDHDHANKAELDLIASGDKAKWDAAAEKANSAVQSVVTGSANGTIAVDGTDVAVKGLGSAAYTEASAYEVAGAASDALAEAKGYVDQKVGSVDLSGIVTNAEAISDLQEVDTDHTNRISALETKVGEGFEEVSESEIDSMFLSE